ncbi:MAG TPA: hypothetical protein EYG79_12395 [Rhodobacteraceae bacterium]|nr:hypothetical protein [Paracoccaceae bacterium]
MEPATPTAIAGIAKIIAGVLALSSSGEPLVEASLPVQLEASDEVLIMLNPVEFEIWESETGGEDVVAQLSEEDRVRFSEFTGRHIGEIVGFSVCGEVIIAPKIMEQINVGGFVLSGPDNNEALLSFLEHGCP